MAKRKKSEARNKVPLSQEAGCGVWAEVKQERGLAQKHLDKDFF